MMNAIFRLIGFMVVCGCATSSVIGQLSLVLDDEAAWLVVICGKRLSARRDSLPFARMVGFGRVAHR